MRQAEAFSVYDLIPETFVIFPQIEKGVQVSFISILVLGTDIAGVLFCTDPHTDGIFTALGFFEFSQKRTFSGTEGSKFLLHFPDHTLVVRFQDPGVAESIAVVEHLLKMIAAESGLVGLFSNIRFHVGGTGA